MPWLKQLKNLIRNNKRMSNCKKKKRCICSTKFSTVYHLLVYEEREKRRREMGKETEKKKNTDMCFSYFIVLTFWMTASFLSSLVVKYEQGHEKKERQARWLKERNDNIVLFTRSDIRWVRYLFLATLFNSFGHRPFCFITKSVDKHFFTLGTVKEKNMI
jgi:hypothetical protein